MINWNEVCNLFPCLSATKDSRKGLATLRILVHLAQNLHKNLRGKILKFRQNPRISYTLPESCKPLGFTSYVQNDVKGG